MATVGKEELLRCRALATDSGLRLLRRRRSKRLAPLSLLLSIAATIGVLCAVASLLTAAPSV